MSSYGNVVNLVTIPDLNFHAFTQGWEHLSEDDLLIPSRLIGPLLDCGFSLWTQRHATCIIYMPALMRLLAAQDRLYRSKRIACS